VESVEVVTPEQERAARSAIAKENHASRLASPLGPDDARWLLAQDVERSIEGGRAAIIRPEVRRRLMSQARNSGLRSFDANLVIAIAQDAARRGESMEAGPEQRLRLVGGAVDSSRLRPLSQFAAAVVLGAALLIGLIAWLMTG
jgi:hypothetical protein